MSDDEYSDSEFCYPDELEFQDNIDWTETNNERVAWRENASFGFFALSSLLVPYNKQLSNLDRSVVTGKSQTSACRIDLAIVRSIRGLSLRFSRNAPLSVIK